MKHDLPGVASVSMPERAGVLSAFRFRPPLLCWSTIMLPLTNARVRIAAQGWLVYDLTRDDVVLGVVSCCQAAPDLIASPIAGAVLDRVDRRRALLLVSACPCSDHAGARHTDRHEHGLQTTHYGACGDHGYRVEVRLARSALPRAVTRRSVAAAEYVCPQCRDSPGSRRWPATITGHGCCRSMRSSEADAARGIRSRLARVPRRRPDGPR